MDEKQAKLVLGSDIQADGTLYNGKSYFSRWHNKDIYITLDGHFDADTLEAIAWWMRNKKISG